MPTHRQPLELQSGPMFAHGQEGVHQGIVTQGAGLLLRVMSVLGIDQHDGCAALTVVKSLFCPAGGWIVCHRYGISAVGNWQKQLSGSHFPEP